MSRSLWRGFDPPTTRPLPRSRNRLKNSTVHYLFSVRNMFFYCLWVLACGQHPASERKFTQIQACREAPLARSSVSVQTITQFRYRASDDHAFADLSMIGKRVQFHDETWQELRLLAAESMKSFQELADEAFNDLLKKHGRPASLKEALRKSAGQTAKVIPLKRRGRTPKGRP